MRKKRDYQSNAIASHDKNLETANSTLLLMATGLGKTIVMSDIARKWSEKGVVLLVAHRVELLDQAADKFEPDLGYRPQIIQADREVYWPSIGGGERVLIGSVQTLRRDKRLEKLISAVESHGSKIVLMEIDEAHHATAASYRKIEQRCREHNPEMKTTGVTATKRADKKAMGIVFESLAFQMDANAGIEQGWLVEPVEERIIVEGVNFEEIDLKANSDGEIDFDQGQLDALMSEEGPLWAVAKPILDRGNKKALVFTAGVQHAQLLAQILNREKPGSAFAVDGKNFPPGHPDRVKAVKNFSHGDLQYLVNFAIFTEGFDAPECEMVVIARPTKSMTVLIQMIGRGLRPLPGVVDGHESPIVRRAAISESKKPVASILYFIPNAANIKTLTTYDALGGNYDEDVRDLAKQLSEEDGGQKKVVEELERAKAAMLFIAEEEARKRIKAKVDYRTERVDDYSPDGVGNDITNINRGGCTDKQIEQLLNLGVPYETAAGYSGKQAWAVIDNMRQSRCTKGQAKVLERAGYDSTQFNFSQAGEVITKLAANGWKRPA